MIENSSPLDDERLRFYLRHKERIEEWAALRTEVRQATIATFAQFGGALEPLAAELDAVVRLDDATGSYPRWVLRRANWPLAAEDALVSVVLEAERSSVDPASPASAPYVGVRVGDAQASGVKLHAAISPLAKRDDFKAKGYRAGSTYWPIFRRVVANPEPAWWESPGDWAVQLAEALRTAWVDLAPVVDEALAK